MRALMRAGWASVGPGVLLGVLLLPMATAWLDAARSVSGHRHAYAEPARRVVVLGFDGVDPRILAEYMDRLPAFRRLARDGAFYPCRTTNPPESPVAWATFATGWNPGLHGIFDFVRRDPRSDDPYLPLNGMVRATPPRLGPLGFPLRPPRASTLRGGEAFWEIVARHGLKVSALRIPVSFPARPLRGGELLCGLGVPDLRATIGSYTLFAAGRDAWEGHTEFGGRHLKIYPRDGVAVSRLEGPLDPRQPGSGRRLEVPVRFRFTGEVATVSVDDGPPVPVDSNSFSPWAKVTFRVGLFVRLRGLVRFRVLRSGDDVAVYASPIQIAPSAPPLPISAPGFFAGQVAERLGGAMKTAGWPQDTFAANDGVLDDVQVYEDIRDTYMENERLCLDRLDHAGASLLTFVFTATDRMQHMFFRYRDERHPARNEQRMADFAARTGAADPIFQSYEWADRTIAAVRERLHPRDVLIVVSDHGFASWRHGVNLNTWLLREGYLVLTDPTARSRPRNLEQFFSRRSETAHIDWSRTRAYALGLGAIYLNLKGRERDGIVDPADRDRLVDEIRSRLQPLEGPERTPVFAAVHRGRDIWHGSRMDEAPDLQCAFAEGYRVSWQTALLGVPEELFEANTYPWSGDHCSSDAAQIPGILLCSHPLAAGSNPGLEDIAPTVCSLFGLPPPELCDGRALELLLD